MKAKIGGLLFFVMLFVAIFGLISFSAEVFFGKSLLAFLKDFLFLMSRKA